MAVSGSAHTASPSNEPAVLGITFDVTSVVCNCPPSYFLRSLNVSAAVDDDATPPPHYIINL